MILILSGNHTKCPTVVAPSSDYTLGEWSPLNHDGLLLSFISSSIDTKTNTHKLCVLVIVLFSYSSLIVSKLIFFCLRSVRFYCFTPFPAWGSTLK